MKKIAIYIPNYNGADFLRKVNIPTECECVVMDNHSEDDSVEVCQERGFICVENDKLVPRTENWLRCINHFKNHDYEWMKWFFIGDELSADAYKIMSNAIDNSNNATVILFDYYINTGKRRVLKSWEDHFRTGLVNAKTMKLKSIEKGPSATLLGQMLSRNCEFEAIDIEGYYWAADVLLLNQIIGNNNIYYCDKAIGIFNTLQRRTYLSEKRKLASYLETEDIIYGIYREYRDKYPDDMVDGGWFWNNMASCLADNINSFSDFLNMLYATLKGFGKYLLKKNGRNLKL